MAISWFLSIGSKIPFSLKPITNYSCDSQQKQAISSSLFIAVQYLSRQLVFYRRCGKLVMKMGEFMLDLFVLDAVSSERIPVFIRAAEEADLTATQDWQTSWTTPFAASLPNRVALCRIENDELLGLMSYELDHGSLAVEIVYVESARHSNANILHAGGGRKQYIGIAKALFAYAVQVSLEAGFDGVLVFRAKTSDLLGYYQREFGARQVGAYHPFRLVIWEDVAERLIAEYRRDTDV